MNSWSKTVAAATLVALVAGPAFAHSKSYCAAQARQTANFQAAGKTVIGAGLGCIIGQIVAKRCGIGAAVGGVSGFAIGSAKWQQVYNHVYSQCRRS
jgi:hypothetical protein